MSINKKITLAANCHPKSDKLAGKRIWYVYESGNTLEQYYIDDKNIRWTGIEGDFIGYSQEEEYYCFEIAPNIFYIIWCEEATIATAAQGTLHKGSYPVCVIADLDKLMATVTYINPNEDGDDDFIIDQARLEIQ